MILIVDNYDSFTYNLLDYFGQLGEQCYVVKNDVSPSAQEDREFDMIVLSPGPGRPEDAGYLLDYIAFYAGKVPMVGICLGHQAIAKYFGGTVEKAIRPMHGKLSKCIKVQEDPLFSDMPSTFEVVRYHSLVVKEMGTELITLAVTVENENMILKHKSLSIFGIQYHPEAYLTEFGMKILENCLKFIRNSHN